MPSIRCRRCRAVLAVRAQSEATSFRAARIGDRAGRLRHSCSLTGEVKRAEDYPENDRGTAIRATRATISIPMKAARRCRTLPRGRAPAQVAIAWLLHRTATSYAIPAPAPEISGGERRRRTCGQTADMTTRRALTAHSGARYNPAPWSPSTAEQTGQGKNLNEQHSPVGPGLDPPSFIRDRLRIATVPSIPEIRLYTAHPASGLWRLPAKGDGVEAPPYWVYQWAGGLALARYLLDRPETVAGLRVLDLGAGSGIVGIAAAMSLAVMPRDRQQCALPRVSRRKAASH